MRELKEAVIKIIKSLKKSFNLINMIQNSVIRVKFGFAATNLKRSVCFLSFVSPPLFEFNLLAAFVEFSLSLEEKEKVTVAFVLDYGSISSALCSDEAFLLTLTP